MFSDDTLSATAPKKSPALKVSKLNDSTACADHSRNVFAVLVRYPRIGVSWGIPRTNCCGIQRTRTCPFASVYFSVRPPIFTSNASSGRSRAQGLPNLSHLSVVSTCHPSRIS